MVKGSIAVILLLLIIVPLNTGGLENNRLRINISISNIKIYNSHDLDDRGDIRLVIIEDLDKYMIDYDLYPSSGTYDIQVDRNFPVSISQVFIVYESEEIVVEIWEADTTYREDEWPTTEYDTVGKISIPFKDQTDQIFVSTNPNDAEITLSIKVHEIDTPLVLWGLTRAELTLSGILVLIVFTAYFVSKLTIKQNNHNKRIP